MSRYPILVQRFKGEESLVIVCERCGAEGQANPDELENDGVYGCPRGCGALAVYKYDEGDKCRGCQKLGYWQGWGGCCSRRCQLQVEYAEQLRRERVEQ